MPTQVILPWTGPAVQYYDRNPTTIINLAALNIGEATRAETEEWTYTVPAGRRALIALLQLGVENRSTMATDDLARVDIDYTPSGSSEQRVISVELPPGNAGTPNNHILTPQWFIFPADVLQGVTTVTNDAPGSVLILRVGMTATEFDN